MAPCNVATAGGDVLRQLQTLHADLEGRTAGWSLAQRLYVDPLVFDVEQSAIFHAGWLLAGHAAEVPKVGDFFVVALPSTSVIVVRSGEDRITALENVCRHRGAVVCDASPGHAANLVCPYHLWTYSLEGTLLHAPQMGDGFERSRFGLRRVHCETIAGLVFISLADVPWPFDGVRSAFEPLLKPHGLDQAAVAHVFTYDIEANWKLVVENQRECYHCACCHPEYVRAHYDTDIDNPAMHAEIAAAIDAGRVRWASADLDVSSVNASSTYTGSWFRANRTPFRQGFVTESLDGRPVAPLLHGVAEADIGTARAGFYTNFWLHAMSDHAVTFRYVPIDPLRTRLTATWLVHRDAVEDRDYSLSRLTAFSLVQLEQDRVILDRQGRGVRSSGYVPGPYSPLKEQNVERFVAWYVGVMAGYLDRTLPCSPGC